MASEPDDPKSIQLADMRVLADKAYLALEYACAAYATWYILVFIYVAFWSMSYPFNLEWMEGQSIDVIQRVLDGKSIYVKPSVDYVAFIYTPLYYYVCAAVAKITGNGFYPARLVSTLSALGAGAIIYAWIRKEGNNWRAGIIGAGLFFATYRLSGRWFDNSRVDSLYLMLSFTCVYVFLYCKSPRMPIYTAILAVAAFFTKQSALFIIAPALAAGVLHDYKKTVETGLYTAILAAVCIVLYNDITGGWFIFFVFRLPAGHEMLPIMRTMFWTSDLWAPLWKLCALAVITLAVMILANWKNGLRYSAFVIGALLAAYIGRMHGYGYINVIMPAHAALGLTAGLAIGFASRYPRLKPVGAVLSLVLLLQMNQLYFKPGPMIPSDRSIEIGNIFLEKLAKIDGEIFIPELQYVQTRVGKKSYPLGMAAFDLLRANLKKRNYIKAQFSEELREAVADGRFAAIMPGRMVAAPDFRNYYAYSQKLEYPKEYVSGAINFLRTDIFMRIPNGNTKQ